MNYHTLAGVPQRSELSRHLSLTDHQWRIRYMPALVSRQASRFCTDVHKFDTKIVRKILLLNTASSSQFVLLRTSSQISEKHISSRSLSFTIKAELFRAEHFSKLK